MPKIYKEAKLNGLYQIQTLIIGASTGEEMARTFYEVAQFLEYKEDLNQWNILVKGIDKNKEVVLEGCNRLQGLSPFIDDPTEVSNYGSAIVQFLNRHLDKARSSLHLEQLDVMDFWRLKRNYSDADIIIANQVLGYVPKKDIRALMSFIDRNWPYSYLCIDDVPLTGGQCHEWKKPFDLYDYYFGMPTSERPPPRRWSTPARPWIMKV